MNPRIYVGICLGSYLIFAITLGIAADPRQEPEADEIVYTVDEFVKRAAGGDLKTVQRFQDAGMDVNARNSTGNLAIVMAAYEDRLPVVGLLIARGASGLNEALSAAAEDGHTRVVRMLLEGGADVNARDANGATALMAAAKDGRSETVRFLIQMGADINAKDNQGPTAHWWANHFGNPETVNLLKDHGAK